MTDWRHSASCRGHDPELFFPVGNSGPALAQIAEAKEVCHRCPVAAQCLAWALDSGQDYGVWGGMSEQERRALKRRKARDARKPKTTHVDTVAIERALTGERVEIHDPPAAARWMAQHGHSPHRISEALGINGRDVRAAIGESS